jgi:hypothetical protein
MLLGVACAAATIAGGSFTYYELLKAGLVHYGKYDHRDRGSLRVGALAPDLDLTMYDGTPVRLSKLWSERPGVPRLRKLHLTAVPQEDRRSSSHL